MSTVISMQSPHHGGAFASSLQLSPAFRSLHAAALRQRQAEFERLRELARSDEFSDDESDGDDDDEEEDEDDEIEQEAVDEATKIVEHTEKPQDVPIETQQLSPRDAASDSDIDLDETVLLPFVRPTVANQRAAQITSPKADDWTMLDRSPTCEGMVYGKLNVSEAWFAHP